MEVKVIKSNKAKVFMDGLEVCREYIRTNKITFGTSSLLPEQTGGVDPGHANSHEIFYVSRGEVLIYTQIMGSIINWKKETLLFPKEYHIN